ncbi:hypothetical protein C7974DRAFT_42200 [Boeremia exigua]|uniref:uncharacterized protein n=1 Tax=Boeremia exigua TaxID=749465 RepID=UPI001E8D0193|nr:uncharacterized protein C7974DRAFT_42200 [Boeremia exigua]KAH6616305.1 hypothetical protein C7974DRAFT_42200 [Boeremia exigua]
MTANCTPGTVILFREQYRTPLWPAVYITDAATPASFLKTRPHGFWSVVLKLAPILNTSHLRWAQTSQMIPFDPSAADDSTKRSTPGLEDAYDVAREAQESGFDLQYWKVILASSQDQQIITIDSDDEDWNHDPQMQIAIKMGLIKDTSLKAKVAGSEHLNARPGPSIPRAEIFAPYPSSSELPLPSRRPVLQAPTPTPSPTNRSSFLYHYPQPLQRASSPFIDSDAETPSPLQKRKRGDHLEDLYDKSPSHRRRKTNIAAGPKTPELISQPAVASKNSARSSLTANQVFRRNGLNASTLVSAPPDADVIEEDLDESSQFVQVFVGPEVDPTSDSNIDPERRKYKLQLLKHHLWDRHYFRDKISARNYFEPIGDNTWELVHPRLTDIQPEDFRWAAEFLSDGDFGIREPENEEQVAEAFAQCMSAWNTAELLSMDDLLEHISVKISAARPWWDLWNVMAFACSIYQSDLALQAHDELKALFSEYIADLFHIYLDDDYLSSTFLTRLKQLPELERDILTKRVARLEQVQPDGVETQEEEHR